MDNDAKISELRMIADSDETDAILFAYLRQAEEIILNHMYPYLEDDGSYDGLTIPARYENKQLHIAAFLLNKRGAEGETQHIENGTHRNYRGPDVPPEMLSDILPRVSIPR